MIEHVPVLLVVVPIIAAALPIATSVVTDRSGWPIAAVGLAVHAALAGWLLVHVHTEGTVETVLAGFEAPFGIELVVDGLSAVVVALVGVVSFGLLAYAREAQPRSNAFYAQYLLLVTGLTGMTVTGDVFNLYVFLEITGLAAYGLVATGRDGSAAMAALKYLLLGTIGASLYLLGVGYLFAATGTLNMADLAQKIPGMARYDSTLIVTAFGLIAGGLAVKVALFPVHTWQPNAYSRAPDTVSALISALVSTVSAYALARLVLSVFTVDFFEAVPLAQWALLAIACVSIVAGSVLAVAQSDVQRMLAYSSVSQFGLVVAGFAIASPLAVVGATVHLVGHAIMKGGLFAATGIIRRTTGARTVSEYAGLGSHVRLGAAGFAVLSVAMVGVPPAVGFVGKWYIVLGAVEAEAWPVVAVVLASTLLTLAYFARMIERLYFAAGDPVETAEQPMTDGSGAVSLGMKAVVVAAAVLAVALAAAVPVYEPTLTETLPTLLQP